MAILGNLNQIYDRCIDRGIFIKKNQQPPNYRDELVYFHHMPEEIIQLILQACMGIKSAFKNESQTRSPS